MAGGKRKADAEGDEEHASFKTRSTLPTGGTTSPPPQTREFLEHVRELNKQFASWVQEQLSKKDSELWVEGVNDYIQHASDIKTKFSEVIDHLSKSNPSDLAKPKENSSSFESSSPLKNVFKDQSSSETLFTKSSSFSFAPIPSPMFTSSSFSSSSFSSSSFSSSPFSTMFSSSPFTSSFASAPSTSFSFPSADSSKVFPPSSFSKGNLGLAPSQETSFNAVSSGKEEENEEEENEEPGSPSMKASENLNEKILYEGRVKLFIKSRDGGSKPWKDMGVGKLNLKQSNPPTDHEKEKDDKDTKASIPFFTFITDVGKRLLNASLYANMKVVANNSSLTMILFTSQEDSSNSSPLTPEFYLMRFGNKAEAEKLKNLIVSHMPEG